MQNSQRQDSNSYAENASRRLWDRFGEMYGARFYESFGSEPSKSWTDAVRELRHDQVRVALAKIRNSGQVHPPSLPEFVALAKNVVLQEPKVQGPQLSTVHAYGNRALLSWLRVKGAVSAASLRKIVAEKNRLCEAYDLICRDEPEASFEMRDKLFEAWDALREDISPDELAPAAERYA